MTYVLPNFQTKVALRRALAKREKVTIFQPGLGALPRKGDIALIEGPHYPAPHSWYCSVLVGPDNTVKRIHKL